MAAAELNAVVNLVEKATTFIAQLQDGWYKGSVGLDTLQAKLLVLRAKHGKWKEQLQRSGIHEDDHLLPLVDEAEKALEKFHKEVKELQESKFRRLRKKIFPDQLFFLVDKILEIVDAGPQLLATSVANNEQLERYSRQTPARLGFRPDRNYVPIADSISAVRNTLENAKGPRIVTLYGGPGMGKTSLVKHLATLYEEEQKRLRADASFPDGVYYLYCGKNAGERVNQLLIELLENLGGAGTANDSTTTGTGGQGGDDIAIASNQRKLRSRLAGQKLLIIMDDLWDPNVCDELLVPAKGVKYLLISQKSDIHQRAETIQIKRPTLKESTQIMTAHTDGLPKKDEFPDNIKTVAEAVIEMLEYHPLALANIGISIDRSRATHVKEWDMIRKHVYDYLDENESYRPCVYDKGYDLPVSASMMRMVESLGPEEQRLLYLMAVLTGQDLPQPVVKYFYSFIQPNKFWIKYKNHERRMLDKSLIEKIEQGGRSTLHCHTLRTHSIRKIKTSDVTSLASQILAGRGDQDVAKLTKRGFADETLVTVLSAMYYDLSLKDVVAGPLENHIKVINEGVIPRSLNIEPYKLDLVMSARQHKYQIGELVWLLNADDGEENWTRQAHEYAKKIIIKFICQGKLEDKSMAGLLRLPQTTSTACATLTALYDCHSEDFYDMNIMFSEAYGDTMHTLLDLFHNNALLVPVRTSVICALLHVLDYESNDAIRNFAADYEQFSSIESNVYIHIDALTTVLGSSASSRRGVFIMAEFPGLLELLFAVLASGKRTFLSDQHTLLIGKGYFLNDVKWLAGLAITYFCRNRQLALKIASLPEALKTLFQLFLSDDSLSRGLRRAVEDALYSLSIVQENRIKFEGFCDGLGSILTKFYTLKLEEVWITKEGLYNGPLLDRACAAAGILGYLALEKDLKDTIASLPGIREGLLSLQLKEMAILEGPRDFYTNALMPFLASTMALTLLYSAEPANPTSTDIPSRGDLALYNLGTQSEATASSKVDRYYFSIFWTRVVACIQMGSYAEGLKNLDLAYDYLDLIKTSDSLEPFGEIGCQVANLHSSSELPDWTCATKALRDCRIFLQAMVEEYAGALLAANRRVEEGEEGWKGWIDGRWKFWIDERWEDLAERGVLKRLSGDLQGALDDLNNAASTTSTWEWFDPKHDVLWQRGYVKYLMDDKAGAKEDAERILLQPKRITFPDREMFDVARDLWTLRKIRVSHFVSLL